MPEPSARAAQATRFLVENGWGHADCTPLAGDASARRYHRLRLGKRSAVRMDAPPGQADDPADFVHIARHLNCIGLSAPRVLAQDLAQGFLLLEDLGDGVFARLARANPAGEPDLYAAATDVLVHLQTHAAPPGLPDPGARDWAVAAAFALSWYRFAITGDAAPGSPFETVLADLLARHADGPRVLILRDYHAENLLWLPRRHGLRRVGLLDFQLAQMGQPAYDLISLLQDARRDVAPGVEPAMIRRFAEKTGRNHETLQTAAAVLGAQRALRILGIFARLCLVSGKSGYLPLIPRVWGQLQRNLTAPVLRPLADICASLLPEPTSENLQRIAAKCGTCRDP